MLGSALQSWWIVCCEKSDSVPQKPSVTCASGSWTCQYWIRETLTEIRRKYWIPRLRSLTRQLLFRRKLEGTSFRSPPPPPLPVFKLKEDTQPLLTALILLVQFTFEGVSWICLFSCYVTRAVHLEPTPDQSSETIIKKFSARRGLPTKFISAWQWKNIQGCFKVPEVCFQRWQGQGIS